jgi:hypothetical protein
MITFISNLYDQQLKGNDISNIIEAITTRLEDDGIIKSLKIDLDNLFKVDKNGSLALGKYFNDLYRTLTGQVNIFWNPPKQEKVESDEDKKINNFFDFNQLIWRFKSTIPAILYIKERNKSRKKQYEYLELLFEDIFKKYLDEYKAETDPYMDPGLVPGIAQNPDHPKNDPEIVANNLSQIKTEYIDDFKYFLFANKKKIQKELAKLIDSKSKTANNAGQLITLNFGQVLPDPLTSMVAAGKKRPTQTKNIKSTKSNLAIKQLDTEIFKILNS